MLLFSTHITPRLSYIVEFVSKEFFGESGYIAITTDKEAFIAAAGPRINYSAETITGCFALRPATPPGSSAMAAIPLLFDSGIHAIDIECFLSKDQKAFFPTAGDFPFDLLAAIFYLLSRYEEYLPHPKDQYGRFPHTHSLAWREGFLDQPLVNTWLQEFKSALSRHYPGLIFRYPSFKFVPTYDIDTAYSYLYKGWRRNIGGALKAVLTGRWKQVEERIAVLRRRKKDPFDVYEWLDSLHLYCRMRPYYFFLAAARQNGVDRNIPITASGLKELIRYHASGSRIGVHPSWQSGDREYLLKEEIG